MKHFRIWLLMQCGHAISRPMQWFDWQWLYPAYNWCLVTSSDLDTEGWLWTDVTDAHDRP